MNERQREIANTVLPGILDETFKITREIGIDMGHRVYLHGSKCRNLHGHRYTIQVTLTGKLWKSGEQDGMVADFGFIKNAMMDTIDMYFDHGTCMAINDPELAHLLGPEYGHFREAMAGYDGICGIPTQWIFGKLYLLNVTPTAENLAKHWFGMLRDEMKNNMKTASAVLSSIRVWETPNCSVEYSE